MAFGFRTPSMPAAADALAGRAERPFEISGVHAVLGTSMVPPFPDHLEVALFAMGCFWGAERLFWTVPGVWTTAVGYAGGYTPNPTYEETCSGLTGHTETVLVVFDPNQVTYRDLLQRFFDEHDPTQGMRQGNDVGSQYRSAVFVGDQRQRAEAEAAAAAFGRALSDAGRGPVTTEVLDAGDFFYAEEYHQQYLHKVPNGYCGLAGTGVSCTLTDPGLKPLATSEDQWRERLTSEQFEVLRRAGTERAFTGTYTDTETPGLYRCMACGNPLHSSASKFHSGCGWPSFTDTVTPEAVTLIEDRSHGMVRTEVRCARCSSHLGHVFPDGPPAAGGLRYCINSVAIDLDERSD